MTETTPPEGELHDAHAIPAGDDELPEQTDNSVKPEDGDQDVDQTPAPTPGSPE